MASITDRPGFVPPPYPYDRLDRFKPLAERFDGGLVDLSIGTPCDPPPDAVIAALGVVGRRTRLPAEHRHRSSCARRRSAWIGRRFDVDVPVAQIGACVGTKEFVGTLPQWLRLRRPDRDTVLYPAVAYPTYEMGAILAGCRPVPVPLDADGALDLAAIDPGRRRSRALALWVNSPSNPTGALDDLGVGGRVGTVARRAGVLRRVLRRVHVERSRSHDPRARPRRRGRRALALEALEPGRRPDRLLRRRCRARALPPRGAQARRA